MSWRIDSQAKTKKQSDLNELTTIVELVLGNKSKEKNESQVGLMDVFYLTVLQGCKI
jgi:hypothetical protein